MSNALQPNLPLTGGCQCGSVRYRITELPLALYACHCTECQKQSSSAFGLSMPVSRNAVEFISGKTKAWERKAESGRSVRCHFCADCGSRIFHESELHASVVSIKPGTLDQTKWIDPVAHVWVRSAQQGSMISDKAIQHQTQPDSFEQIGRAWVAWFELNGQ